MLVFFLHTKLLPTNFFYFINIKSQFSWCLMQTDKISKGPSIRVLWDKYQLLKTMMFLESFGFYKMFLKSWYLQLEIKKNVLLFHDFF